MPKQDEGGTPEPPSIPKHGRSRWAKNHEAGQNSAAPAAGGGIYPRNYLEEFLLGRPDPARVAARRAAEAARNHEQWRKSVSGNATRRVSPGVARVHAELRQEMRAAAVRRLKHPGHVQDRVKAWQRSNVQAMKEQGARGHVPVAEDGSTEPKEVAEQAEEESVTKEDRMKTRMRKYTGRRRSGAQAAAAEMQQWQDEDESGGWEDGDKPEERGAQAWSKHGRRRQTPRKRIVSDENWLKSKKKSPPRQQLQTAPKPSVKNKVKDWATRVELADRPPPRGKHDRVRTMDETASVTMDDQACAFSTRSEDGVGTLARRARPSRAVHDNGLRARPSKARNIGGVRVKAAGKQRWPDDDGIRIRPGLFTSADGAPFRPALSGRASKESSRTSGAKRDRPRTRVCFDDDETEASTAPRLAESSRAHLASTRHRASTARQANTRPDHDGSIDEETERRQESALEDSQPPPTVARSRLLADIPFGCSALSEPDLLLGAQAGQRAKKQPRDQRAPPFKAVPGVFKRVVSAAKEMMEGEGEAARSPATNRPATIESWLKETVDPFVENTATMSVLGKRRTEDSRAAEPVASKNIGTETAASSRVSHEGGADSTDQPTATTHAGTARPQNAARTGSATTGGLTRKGATRIASSPFRLGAKQPLRDVLKRAFRGESGGQPATYPSVEAGKSGSESDSSEDDTSDRRETRRRWGGGFGPCSEAPSTASSEQPKAPRGRTRPPTKGVHTLSTIVSGVSCSADEADVVSALCLTTGTSTAAVSARPKSGPKRRLTKHSDLVSALSLPDDDQPGPATRPAIAPSSRSLHRMPGRLDQAGLHELLQEFADDERFYARELKTLVDGVVPVLLAQAVHGADLFARAPNSLARSVVAMGVALEKLKQRHKRVPIADMYATLRWLDGVAAVYDEYLDAWRLGFQDLVVNLAPVAGDCGDQDSLVDALPRNEQGDLVGENGERVDVAHLLKRPVVRIRWMTRFARVSSASLATKEADDLVARYEGLQDKARKRLREEVARITDEDANQTDTTRARDLFDLAPLDSAPIDARRQVVAKDAFSLDLAHSSGQRLACPVELIYRDNPGNARDRGDILIRDVGGDAPAWLLFPPVPREHVSVCRGSKATCLALTIRGTVDGRDFGELVELWADSDQQVADWLAMLGSSPLAPTVPSLARPVPIISPPSPRRVPIDDDVPVGERRRDVTRSGPHSISLPSTPPTPDSPRDYVVEGPTGRAACLESLAHHPLPSLPSADDTAKLGIPGPHSTLFRDDGAPPPPIHRTLGPQRRASSPLKHEYQVSDESSASSDPETEASESESESSGDELDEDDVPDTMPGYSLLAARESSPKPAASVVSDDSVAPSQSASRIGAAETRAEQSFAAAVSYWCDRKGRWKDMHADAYAIVVVSGGIEVHRLKAARPRPSHQSDHGRPVVALGLTPVVMIRQSTSLDLEVRGRCLPGARLAKVDSIVWRFRTTSSQEAKDLYDAVHHGRLTNARYIALAEEARVRAFGQMQPGPPRGSGDGSSSNSSGRRRSWLAFGRSNSYRASTRAPPSQGHSNASTGISACSFLQKLTQGGGNATFNLDRSTLGSQSRPGSAHVAGLLLSAPPSLYGCSNASSYYGGAGLFSGCNTPPRSASASLSGSGRWGADNGGAKLFSPDKPLEIRCHLLVNRTQWADKGSCILHVMRPPPGRHQQLSLYHGLEKRIVVLHASKTEARGEPLVLLDAVLGSKCFSMIGTRGIMCSVWEDLRDEDGRVGVAPRSGGLSGRVTKWCFQCGSVRMASFVMGLVTSEVPEVLGA